MPHALNDAALDQLFRTARPTTPSLARFDDDPAPALLRPAGSARPRPTAPARIVFVKSEAKAKLGPR